MEKYVNIPSTGFQAVTMTTSKRNAVAMFNESGQFTLSSFSIFQLLAGARNEIDTIDGTYVEKSLVSLYMKMNETLLSSRESELKTVDLNRIEVQMLLQFLLARMAHCEEERDARNPNFNPDTYIGMKILVLELKEWLLGNFVPDSSLDDLPFE